MFADDNQQTNDGNEPTTVMPSEPITARPADDSMAAAASSLTAASSYEMTDAPDDASSTAPMVAPVDDAAPAAAPQVSGDDQQDLLSLKKDVLNELAPLVGHIDQSPEEKFKTTMMMLQSTDNHALVKTAYEAAQQITDEKVRAAALLDIVNEINYFTQQA